MAAPSRDWVGQVLGGGRYRVAALLGEGGMGLVYRAHDGNLDADVVIKAPRRSMLDDPDFARRFGLEVRSLVRLSHPGIVKVTDVGQHDGLPFAVMQFLPGGDLEGRQRRTPDGRALPADPASLVGWLPGVAAALDFIHKEGFIHRDVKPANILFDRLGHPFLSDFGVAKVLGAVEAAAPRGASVTGAGMLVGTPEYMPRELIMGEPFDGRVDQYALAVTTYEVLCGRKPFAGETATAILVRQVNQEPPPLDELPAPAAAGLSRAILRALSKDPAGRFASCGEFAAAVLAAAEAAPRPAGAGGAAGKLACPSCGKGWRIPDAILADPARVRGRKVECKACRAPLRFADQGLFLVPDEPAPARSGTILLDAPGGAVAGRAPGVTTLMREPARRPADPTLRLAASDPGTDPAAATPNPSADANALPSSRRTAMIAGGVAVAAGLLGLAALLSRVPTRPAPRAATAAISPAPPAPPAVSPRPIPQRPAVVAAPADRPIPAQPGPVVASLPPPADPAGIDPAASGAGGPAAMVATVEPAGLEAIKAEVPEPAESTVTGGVEALAKVSLEELAADPGRFEGQLVVPNEMLRVETSALRPWTNPLPLIVACKHLNLGSGRADVRFPIVASPALAEKLREAIRSKKLDDDASMAILDIRVRKDPGRPGEFVGVVERCEFLLTWSGAKIFQEKYGRAFLCLVVTGDAVEQTDHGGDRWRARLGTLIPTIRNEYKRMANHQRDQLFSQMERQLQRDTNSVNKVLQQQQADMLRRAFPLR